MIWFRKTFDSNCLVILIIILHWSIGSEEAAWVWSNWVDIDTVFLAFRANSLWCSCPTDGYCQLPRQPVYLLGGGGYVNGQTSLTPIIVCIRTATQAILINASCREVGALWTRSDAATVSVTSPPILTLRLTLIATAKHMETLSIPPKFLEVPFTLTLLILFLVVSTIFILTFYCT